MYGVERPCPWTDRGSTGNNRGCRSVSKITLHPTVEPMKEPQCENASIYEQILMMSFMILVLLFDYMK